jgi:glucose/arabinose dehydrogenase
MRRSRRVFCVAAIAIALVSLGGCKEESGGNGLQNAVTGGAGAGASGAGGGAGGQNAAPTGGVGAAGNNPGMAGMGSGGATGGTGSAAGAGGMGGSTAGTGGGASGSSGGNGWFTIPDSCGAPMPNAMAGNACPGSPPPAIKLTEIATGLVSPTYAIQAPGDPSRIYVTEQLGPVRVIKDGMLQAEPLFDLRDVSGAAINSDQITPGYSESGLMNMVFHPKFATNRKFYVNYTKTGPVFALAEFTMAADYTVDVTSFREIVTYPQWAFNDSMSCGFPVGTANSTNHVGSSMEFGPDGCLYLSRGEGGGENDCRESGQDTSDTESSILRIDIDNPGTPPPGNLEGYVWNYGFRNPWRMSFDRVTGDLYIGDVGQDSGAGGFEELNVEPRGVMGSNYGWGPTAGDANCSAAGGCRKPAVTYPTISTANSAIGGYVYRGSAIPGMVGRYIWADWTERKIKTFVYKGETGGQPEICDEHDTGVTVATKVRSFGQALDGEIYVVAGGAPTAGLSSAGLMEAGTLYRIDPM